MAPDPKDIQVLIPRVRRAIDGPAADAADAPAATLNDVQVTGLIADSIAEVILYTGGLFGYTLDVTDRDDTYGAPNAWQTDEVLSDDAATVIAAQAALDYYFHTVKGLKVSETITQEGRSWQYALSASVLRDQLKALRDARDRALAALTEKTDPALETYVSFLAVRDAETAALIEPWTVFGGGLVPVLPTPFGG